MEIEVVAISILLFIGFFVLLPIVVLRKPVELYRRWTDYWIDKSFK